MVPNETESQNLGYKRYTELLIKKYIAFILLLFSENQFLILAFFDSFRVNFHDFFSFGFWYTTVIIQGLLYLDGRNSQKYLHQDQADF